MQLWHPYGPLFRGGDDEDIQTSRGGDDEDIQTSRGSTIGLTPPLFVHVPSQDLDFSPLG